MTVRKVWQLLDDTGFLVKQDRLYTKLLAFAKKEKLSNYEIVSAFDDDGNFEPGTSI